LALKIFSSSNFSIFNSIQRFFPFDSGTVCGQYASGEVVGDLCDKFCGDVANNKANGDVATLKVDSCQSWHGGKELVFSATLGGKKVKFLSFLEFTGQTTKFDYNKRKIFF
jgi:hypothetical protein